MIVLDMTIVNVALPTIREHLKFSESSLAWVINAYLLTSGGFLLLGGRLGDLYGHRRLFLIGIAAFTLASLACGLANSQPMLVIARATQGLGGAIVDAVSLSLIVDMFTETGDRTKAMGVYGFVCSAGGSIAAVLGGFLVNSFDWHWIFLVNIPIGIAVIVLTLSVVPAAKADATDRHLDVGGAITVTTALMLAIYAIVNGNEAGWASTQTLGLLAGSVALLIVFVVIESRVKVPLMPLGMLRLRNLATANIVATLWAAAMFAWFFLSALYLQLVLGYTPMKVGLAFVPTNVIMAVMSVGISAKLVMRFGIKAPLAAGLAFASAGLLLFARAPVDGTYMLDVLPPMLLLGIGAGVAFNPVLMAVMNDVEPSQSGLASGIVNTSFMMGGALGLAVLASIAGSATAHVLANGAAQAQALNGGYHVAFLVGALFAALAAVIGLVFLRTPKPGAALPAH
jgi:EmrB/QacA subfamily drug resistance transporter